MDQLYAEFRDTPATQVFEVAKAVPTDDRLIAMIKGTTIESRKITKTVALQLGDQGPDGRKRVTDAGLQLVPSGDQMQIGAVKFGSRAQKSGFEQGWEIASIKVASDRPTPHWFYLPALLLIGLVWWSQVRRMVRAATRYD